MKKIFFLVFITALCCAFLFSCKNTTDTEKLYLIKQTMSDKSVTVTTEFIYNQDYRVVKHKTNANGVSNTYAEIGYDENGYQNYQKDVSISGFVTETFITNDASGRIIEARMVSNYNGNETETIISYEYTDKNGSYVQTSTSGTVTTVIKDKHGNTITQSDNKGQLITYENKYDKERLIETKNTLTVGTHTIVTITKYEYDIQGNKTKETNYDSDGTVISTQVYEYSSNVVFID